jgi:hypothetical protein
MTRAKLGLPAKWATVWFWLSACTTGIHNRPAANIVYRKKCPEIPVLKNYGTVKDKGFWGKFPKFKPKNPVGGKICLSVLEDFVKKCWPDWTRHQRVSASRCIQIMTHGAVTELVQPLGPLNSRNAKSAMVQGEMMMDTIAV